MASSASSSMIPPGQEGRPSQAPRLRRARMPKTRGGCITCKARHVKCDETKPSCLRCLRFWGKCDGYPPPKQDLCHSRAPKAIHSDLMRPLLPHPRNGNRVILYQDLTANGFRNDQEHHYFQTFRTETVEGLAGMFKSELWERVILQACWDEEFVRDAAVAIGALSSCGRSLIETPSSNQQAQLPNVMTGTSSYRFALQHYGQAVKKMRKSISSDATHLRKALVGCLLVICFEGLQGNYTQALTHAVSGNQLLRGWLSKQEYRDPKMEGIASPNSYVIEDELVQAFGRLDLQVMAYVDPRPASDHERLMREGELTILHMPAIFTSVNEARLYWELVQRRSSHFIATTAAQSLRTGKDVPTVSIDLGAGEPAVLFHAESDIYKSLPIIGDERMPPEYRKYSGEIAQWFSAFTSFYEGIEKETDERSWTAALLLQIHAKTSEIMLLSSLFGDESSLDRFMPEYREVVASARAISGSQYFQMQKFKFDLGIVNPLRLVAKWCREGGTRREAIGLLRESRVREGLYDGLIMAGVQEWIMELEEEGLVDGIIKEEMRWRYTSIRLDCLRRRADVEAERLGRNGDGTRDVRGTVITW